MTDNSPGTGTLGVLYYGLQPMPAPQALTLTFTTFVLFQFFNVFNTRTGDGSAISWYLFTNGKLWLALGGVLGLQALAMHWLPAQKIFHTVALGVGDWLLAFAVAASILVPNEGRKLAARLRQGRGAQQLGDKPWNS